VILAAQAAKMEFRWNVGNGRRVRFLEDQWFGTCSLAIQYWEIYLIVNEHGCTIREAWDGENLKISFRRAVNSRLMQLWYELVEIARGIQFTDEEDVMIWQFDSSGVFSVQSLYAVINDRGWNKCLLQTCGKYLFPRGFISLYGFLLTIRLLSGITWLREDKLMTKLAYLVMRMSSLLIYSLAAVWPDNSGVWWLILLGSMWV
jgi:hypothetical protein